MATVFNKKVPEGFEEPTQLPDSEKQAKTWQIENYRWWEENPMRYDWADSIGAKEFTREFFSEIDRRFFENAHEYLKDKNNLPFNEFVGFKTLRDRDVLEIGAGLGSHAQLLAEHAKSFCGIDITDYAVRSTRKRIELFGSKADILKMDAEKMEFPDSSFDFVWSWGVIHHSANTRKVLEEIYRVLRPGGKAVIMVYHRGWWNYYLTGFLRAFATGDLFKHKSLAQSVQSHTDGALARYYSCAEWRRLTGDLFDIEWIETRGPKSDVILLPASATKRLLMHCLPSSLSLFLTRLLRMGTFLISSLRKVQTSL